MTNREFLFRGFNHCSDHNCLIGKPKGMGTNGGCKCLVNMTRTQLTILSSRLQHIANNEVLNLLKLNAKELNNG